MRALLAIAVLAGCTGDEELPLECQCVDYVVRSNTGFDRIVVQFDAYPATEHVLEPTTMFLARYSDPFHGPERLVVTAYDAQGVVGTGTAELEYEHVVDYYYEAKGTLWLASP